MHVWEQRKDGWSYCQDGTQRWKKAADGSVVVESVPVGETLTQQQFIDDCDVNRIMERFMKTGLMPESVAPMLEGDFTNMPSYAEALQTVIDANDMFMEIPAKTRLRFENDPQKLMDFLADEKNYEESVQLGLRVPKAQPVVDPNTQILTEIASNTRKKTKTIVVDDES